MRFVSLAVVAAMVAGSVTAGSGTALAAADTGPHIHSYAYSAPGFEADLAYNVGVPGQFDFVSSVDDADAITWRTDDGQSGTVDADDYGNASVMIAPRRAGLRTITARTIGHDGTESDEGAYEFQVDNGPLVKRGPHQWLYLGETATFDLTPRRQSVVEYRYWPKVAGRELPERTTTLPARADGTADFSWYMDDTRLDGFVVRSLDAGGELSEPRMVHASPDPAAPVIRFWSETWGLVEPQLFKVGTGMPDVVAYDVTLNDDPATTHSVPADADGDAILSITPTRLTANHIDVTARNARGLRTATTRETWNTVDSPQLDSVDFPLDTTASGRKAEGTFTFTSRRPGTTAFEWRTGAEWATLPAGPDGKATLTWTPPSVGTHNIWVRSVQADGTRSAVGQRDFSVGIVNAKLNSVSPATVTTGAKRTLTLQGLFLHPRDTVQITPAGRAAIPARVLSVNGTGEITTVEADFTDVPPGRATISLMSHGGNLWQSLVDGITVQPLPALKVAKLSTVSGTVRVGYTVSATPGTWTPAATSVRYQWRANGVAIAGATASSFKIPASVAGQRLSVVVTASRPGNTSASAASAWTVAVAKGTAPRLLTKPTISGTAKVGRTVTASTGSFSPAATSYRYEWRLNGTLVKGATGRSLKLTSSMNGRRLTLTVVCVRAGYLDARATTGSVTVRR